MKVHCICLVHFKILLLYDYSTLRPYHVKVGERANGRPEDGAGLDRLDPHGVGEEHAEDGDTLVIVGAGH